MNPNVGTGGAETLSFAAANGQHALIIEFDNSATSTGRLDRQNSSYFTLNFVSGGYAFFGLDTSQFPPLSR